MGSCLPQGTRLRAGHITGTPNMSVGVASPCILEEMVSCGGNMSPPNSSSSPNSGPEDRQTQHRQFDKSSYEHIDAQYDCLLPLQNGVPAGEEEGLAELAQTHPSKGEAIQLPLRHFWLRSHFICTPNRSGGRDLWEGGCTGFKLIRAKPRASPKTWGPLRGSPQLITGRLSNPRPCRRMEQASRYK